MRAAAGVARPGAREARGEFRLPPSLPEAIGKYTIERFIESGGMGDVYLARDPALDRAVAIKFLREGFDNQEMRERFEREARAAGRLSHPNIVTIYEFGIFDGRPFIAMEFVRGEPLSKLIRRRESIPLVRKLEMMEGLCSGLAHAHKTGMVHRDIKPANLMVDNDGGPLKILDFGIVRMAGSGLTSHGVLVGTINYMSPEQITGRGTIDLRSDVFAVGAVLHEVFTYQRAFPGEMTDVLYKIVHAQPDSAATLSPGLDPGIVRAIDQCLEKTPERRYQDLGVLRRDLARIRQRLELEESETHGHTALTMRQPKDPASHASRPSGAHRTPAGHASAVDAAIPVRRGRRRRQGRRRRRPPIAPVAPRRPPRSSRARNARRKKRASSSNANPRSRRGSRPNASSRSGWSRNGPSGRGSRASGRRRNRPASSASRRSASGPNRRVPSRRGSSRRGRSRPAWSRRGSTRRGPRKRNVPASSASGSSRPASRRRARRASRRRGNASRLSGRPKRRRSGRPRRAASSRQRDLAQAQKDVAAGRFAEAAGLLRPWAAESAGDAAFAAVLKQAEAGVAQARGRAPRPGGAEPADRLGQRAGRAAGLRRRQPRRAGGPRRAPESHAARRTSNARSRAASNSGPGPPPPSNARARCSTPARARRWSCWSGSRRRTASWTAPSPTCGSATPRASASGCAARSRPSASSRSRPLTAQAGALARNRAVQGGAAALLLLVVAIASWSTIFPPKPIEPAPTEPGTPESGPATPGGEPDRTGSTEPGTGFRPPAPARAPAARSEGDAQDRQRCNDGDGDAARHRPPVTPETTTAATNPRTTGQPGTNGGTQRPTPAGGQPPAGSDRSGAPWPSCRRGAATAKPEPAPEDAGGRRSGA